MLRIADSALKHGCTREDISHAYDRWLYEGVVDDDADPPKVLVIGPNGAGTLLELIGADLADGDTWIWHAMACRSQYLDLLPGQGGAR